MANACHCCVEAVVEVVAAAAGNGGCVGVVRDAGIWRFEIVDVETCLGGFCVSVRRGLGL